MSTDEKEQERKLVELIRDVVARDKALREKYEIGDKFRFVRDRLDSLLLQLETHVDNVKIEEKKTIIVKTEDEVFAYVYLYNSQGATLVTWINMLTPKLFYEYSVNRPIYLDKNHIESLIKSKANRVQHAYLTVAIKQNDLITNENAPKDPQGNTVMKVREGSLKFERFIALTHNDQDFVLTEQGALVKKPTG
ncbi:MAG: type IVB secretion system protein IcmQ [Pseudomonadota bacterium]